MYRRLFATICLALLLGTCYKALNLDDLDLDEDDAELELDEGEGWDVSSFMGTSSLDHVHRVHFDVDQLTHDVEPLYRTFVKLCAEELKLLQTDRKVKPEAIEQYLWKLQKQIDKNLQHMVEATRVKLRILEELIPTFTTQATFAYNRRNTNALPQHTSTDSVFGDPHIDKEAADQLVDVERTLAIIKETEAGLLQATTAVDCDPLIQCIRWTSNEHSVTPEGIMEMAKKEQLEDFLIDNAKTAECLEKVGNLENYIKNAVILDSLYRAYVVRDPKSDKKTKELLDVDKLIVKYLGFDFGNEIVSWLKKPSDGFLGYLPSDFIQLVADLHHVGIKDTEAKEASFVIYRHLRPVNKAILEYNNQAYAFYWKNFVQPNTEYQTMMKLMENWMAKGVLGRNSTAPYSVLATLRNWWKIELVNIS